jgi:putative ABC transport system ATP-binding protein
MSSNDTPSPAIQTIDVTKAFDHGLLRALDGVSLAVNEGEFVAVTGPSGCGKSTLLHLVAALDAPTSGSILIHGQDLRVMPNIDRFRRREIGLVFQLHNLLPHLTALQNVEIAMFSNGQPHRQQRQRARDLLAAVDLAGKADTSPPRLSGGERQRLAVARALANEPPILLADEPTGSLDSASVENLLKLLADLRAERRLTILLVTHDSSVAAAADRIIHMRDGRIVDPAPGPTSTASRLQRL